MELRMEKTEREAAERLALETALAILVSMLDEKGVLAKEEFRRELQAKGASLVTENLLGFTQQVGRDMAGIAKRI
jgi:methylmalonyl-CoA mutase cobalamin-binding subunit